MRYRVEFEYQIPEWGEIEIDADDKTTASHLALAEFEKSFPEAVDITIIEVTEIG